MTSTGSPALILTFAPIDMCPSCGGPEDIDLSVGTFSAIDPNYQTHGVRNIKWWYTS